MTQNKKTRDSQIKAIAKYNKNNTVTYTIRLNKHTDTAMIEFLNGLKNKTGTIKKLIADEMKKSMTQK